MPEPERFDKVGTEEKWKATTSGLYVSLEIETQHSDPNLGRGKKQEVHVWQQRRFISYSPDAQEARSLDFEIVFQRVCGYREKTIRTPADYYT